MPIINKLNTLIGKLKFIKISADLRKLSLLRPVQKNGTKWSIIPKTISRYMELKPFIPSVNFSNNNPITSFIPAVFENSILHMSDKDLKKFESITLAFHLNLLTMAKTNYLFNNLVNCILLWKIFVGTFKTLAFCYF